VILFGWKNIQMAPHCLLPLQPPKERLERLGNWNLLDGAPISSLNSFNLLVQVPPIRFLSTMLLPSLTSMSTTATSSTPPKRRGFFAMNGFFLFLEGRPSIESESMTSSNPILLKTKLVLMMISSILRMMTRIIMPTNATSVQPRIENVILRKGFLKLPRAVLLLLFLITLSLFIWRGFWFRILPRTTPKHFKAKLLEALWESSLILMITSRKTLTCSCRSLVGYLLLFASFAYAIKQYLFMNPSELLFANSLWYHYYFFYSTDAGIFGLHVLIIFVGRETFVRNCWSLLLMINFWCLCCLFSRFSGVFQS